MSAGDTCSWFHHGAIDAQKEKDACLARSPECWAFLVSRLASAALDRESVAGDCVAANPDLHVYFVDREAVAYRFRNDRPEVLMFAEIHANPGMGAFVSEALRRVRLGG